MSHKSDYYLYFIGNDDCCKLSDIKPQHRRLCIQYKKIVFNITWFTFGIFVFTILLLSTGNAGKLLHHVDSRIRDDIYCSGFGFLWIGLKPRCTGQTTGWNRSALSGQGTVQIYTCCWLSHIFIFDRLKPVCIKINFQWIWRTLIHILLGDSNI